MTDKPEVPSPLLLAAYAALAVLTVILCIITKG